MVAGPCKVARAARDCQEEEKITVVRPIVLKGSIVKNLLQVIHYSRHTLLGRRLIRTLTAGLYNQDRSRV